MKRVYSDEELLRLEFFTTRPYDQSSLVENLAPGEQITEVINIYSYEKYPDLKARCIHCHRAGHRDGFTARTSLGNLCLLGSHCGEDAAGATWHELAKDFEARRDRQHYLRLAELAKKELPGALRELAGWGTAIGRLEAAHRRFSSELPDVYALLLGQCQRGELSLTITKAEWAEIPEASGPGVKAGARQSRYVEKVEFAHRLQGAPFFDVTNPEKKFDAALEVLRLASKMSDRTERPSLDELRTMARQMREAAKVLGALLNAHAAIPTFFTASNVGGIAEYLRRLWTEAWAGHYWSDGAVLHHSKRAGEPSNKKMSAPDYSPLRRTPLEAIERVIRTQGRRPQAVT